MICNAYAADASQATKAEGKIAVMMKRVGNALRSLQDSGLVRCVGHSWYRHD
jgi:hypothetical protein